MRKGSTPSGFLSIKSLDNSLTGFGTALVDKLPDITDSTSIDVLNDAAEALKDFRMPDLGSLVATVEVRWLDLHCHLS